ncbi:MAG: hypothetical protein JWO78_2408 [Micavibrio sp.]|nr:hypothetical protein [Micavibrio sp.]
MWTEAEDNPFGLAVESSAQATLATMMTVDLMVNERGNIWVLHNKPLPMILNWAEYDVDLSTLTFVAQDGEALELGMTIHKPLQKPMMAAREVYVVLMDDKEIKDMYILPLMVRDTKFNRRSE